MDFKQLQSFEAVVKYKSFTKAAGQLFISQPTISTHIRQLEEEFSTQFIYRTTKSIEVTPRGVELYQFAEHILMLKNSLIKRWNDENNNTVELGASTIPSAYILPEILPSFLNSYPDIHFNIHQYDSQGVIDGLLNGSFEIGLVGMNNEAKDIEFIPFYQDSMVLVTPRTEYYLSLKERNMLIQDILLQEPIILRKQGSGTQKFINLYFESKGINETDLNVIARLNDQESIKHLVMGGLGISIISQKAASVLEQEKKLLTFDLPEGRNVRELYIAYQKYFPLRKQTKHLMDYILSYYKAD